MGKEGNDIPSSRLVCSHVCVRFALVWPPAYRCTCKPQHQQAHASKERRSQGKMPCFDGGERAIKLLGQMIMWWGWKLHTGVYNGTDNLQGPYRCDVVHAQSSGSVGAHNFSWDD